uniref:Uncharacterized protein n=1 Tax=Acrobeloides nanus TaxID=290746 RepID=A0A914CCN4_9BILA
MLAHLLHLELNPKNDHQNNQCNRWYLKIADWAFYLGEKFIGFFFGVNQESGAVHPATEVQGRLPPKI